MEHVHFRELVAAALWFGCKALRKGASLSEWKPDARKSLYEKLPADLPRGPRRYVLSERETMLAECVLGVKTSDLQAFQEKVLEVLQLEIAIAEERIQEERLYGGKRKKERLVQGEAARAPRAARPSASGGLYSWPSVVDGRPTPTADDLPELFGEASQ
jgi:hypothetical protein